MGWRERDEGARAHGRGIGMRGNNPHNDGYDADYDERRNARDWEDGYREDKRREERKREDDEREAFELRKQQERMEERRREEEVDYWQRQEE